MSDEYEVVWDGRELLTDSIDRDYADMRGDGWDLYYTPPSPLTTDWRDIEPWARPDSEQFVRTELERPRKGPQRKATRVLMDWEPITISQTGRGRR